MKGWGVWGTFPGRKSGSGTGLLGSRSDIAGIFSSLTSSAMDMHRPEPEGRDGSSSASSSATATASSPFLSQTFQAAARGRATSATPTPTAGGLTVGGGGGGGGGGSGGGLGSGTSGGLLDPNAGRSTRSNSFDVSLLNNAKQLVSDVQDNGSATLTGWFAKRHTPLARKKSVRSKSSAVALSKDVLERLQKKDPLGGDSGKPKLKPRSKQKTWAESTKATVDATILGTAIEGFLRKSSNASMGGSSMGGPGSSGGASTSAAARGATPKAAKESGSASGSPAHGARRSRASAGSSAQSQAGRAVRSTLNWFGKADEDDSKDTCDASLCATLKDLFVK